MLPPYELGHTELNVVAMPAAAATLQAKGVWPHVPQPPRQLPTAEDVCCHATGEEHVVRQYRCLPHCLAEAVGDL